MTNKLQTIKFYEDELQVIIDEGGVGYVILRRLCDNLGIDSKNQREKIENDPKFMWGLITSHDVSGRKQKLFCIRWDQVLGWLFSINSNRVLEENRKKLLRYQTECFQVLHEYFTQGGSINPRVADTVNPQEIIDATIARFLEKTRNHQVELLELRQKQQELVKQDIELYKDIADKWPEANAWAKTCVQAEMTVYQNQEQDTAEYPFFLSDIFREKGYADKEANRLAQQFGKDKHVQTFKKGVKLQLVNGNTRQVNYYWLSDKPGFGRTCKQLAE